MSSFSIIPIEATIVRFNSQPLLLEDQQEELKPLIAKIQRLSQPTFSQIAIPLMKHCLKNFKEQSLHISAAQITALLFYLNLLGVGTLTMGSSGVLLASGNYSEVVSVEFANDITNAAALLCFMTDLPPITFGLYWFIMRKAYVASVRELMDKGYHAGLNEELTPEMREKLYQWHISQLQELGVDDFYLNPDPLSFTGAIHEELAPTLAQIDQSIREGVSLQDLSKNCLNAFKEASFATKASKVAVLAVPPCVIGLALFLIFENYVLIVKTPVKDLFTGNKTDQYNEAFYLTQLGGVFSSVTAMAVSIYLAFIMCFRSPYRKAKCEKIEACFREHKPVEMSTDLSNELYRIKEIKLKNA